eukprot:TRINITY_DN2556_c0_g2_i1.p1 TRINITY_DN2556_c0_g2~~TRINITY_DN2556_c0_g2_i1.p1  ORF type:complete len:118 (-),score=12.82 TRINITY_DN2556_c0_g2_i1:23-376(-)
MLRLIPIRLLETNKIKSNQQIRFNRTVNYMDEEQRKQKLEELCKRRFIYTPSFEVYGGVKGLYDYGPLGCSMMNNLVDSWRSWFVHEENMLQVSTASVTPEIVFQYLFNEDKESSII